VAERTSLKLELRFRDRVGIVADISARIAGQGLNIVRMEVQRSEEETLVYVDIESAIDAPGRGKLLTSLGGIPDLVQIRPIATLPHEERENRFRVVLDNISDGVVSIDGHGRLTTINRVACRALGQEPEEVLGKPVQSLGLPETPILDCLNGKQFSNLKQDLITGEGRFQYLATGRPIRDSEERIIGAVEIAKDLREIRKLARALSEPEPVTFSDIVGNTPAIREAVGFARKIAGTGAVVTISGESGTGKELFARAIHTAGGRSGPFVPVNCAALPDNLLESELFGYEAGAFTGGRRQGRPGLFETAGEGTLLLDEIAEMSPGSQAKILRTLQENTVRRVGGAREIPVHCRVIASTNRNLKRMVEAGAFRQDLYYRINVLPIHIPPLRERPEDIPALVDHFLFQLAAGLGKSVQRPAPEALDKLARHAWPGNVRELKNVVERGAILSEGDSVDVGCILFGHELERGAAAAARGRGGSGPGRSLRERVAAFEKELIAGALEVPGSIRGTARRLGISHTALLKKMHKYDLGSTAVVAGGNRWDRNG